ncbi:ATP-binding protein, partial [Gemmatimonadota bacterium]
MRLEILGWKSTGLRSPDFEIDLTVDGSRVHRVSLIQMPNGTGKTTTLRCLRAALTGEARDWSPEDVKELGRRDVHSGYFKLQLRADGRPITFNVEFDFVEGSVTYSTTFGRGMQSDYLPPP